jgi:hypothetical protein
MVLGKVRRAGLAAANQAYAAATDGRNLIADLADGFALETELEITDDVMAFLKKIITGDLRKGDKVPVKMNVKIDPSYDTD